MTCLIVPNDVQSRRRSQPPPREHGTVHSGARLLAPRVVPAGRRLDRAAAEVLNAGERVAMLVGAGRAATRPTRSSRSPRLLGAGVAKALLGKAVLPDDLPFVTGSIGLLGTKPSWDLMMGCDTLLMVGSSFPYSEFLPKEGKARGVQIDLDGRMVGIRYPMEVNLVGDAQETLRALHPAARAQGGPRVARGDRGGGRRVVEADGGAGDAGRRPDQPAARLPRAVAAPAGRCDLDRRFGLVRELVRARHQDAQGDAGVALGHARDDGPRRSVCDRSEVRASRTAR